MKTKGTRLLLAFLLALMLYAAFGTRAAAEEQDETVYHVTDAEGAPIFTIHGALCEGDEYISNENILYRIESVQEEKAIAKRIGYETMPDVSWLDTGETQAVFSVNKDGKASAASDVSQEGKRLIAMYVTHSDESYVPTDGTQSIYGQGGIYDVARAFKEALQEKGVDVIFDESTHLPHDAGAYRRSRQTAERLLQKRPDAIIDIHRDGIPDKSEYTCTIDGESASQVRLLVGRSNQNSAVNRDFAKQIKAVADKKYPGLIKDIFIGKGNYNQDLSPNAILLEFGTHTLSKERALASTTLMADVVNAALYGTSTGSAPSKEAAAATEQNNQEKNKSSLSSLFILILIVAGAVLLFAFVQTGGGHAMKDKIGRGVSEITGGLAGKKRKKH